MTDPAIDDKGEVPAPRFPAPSPNPGGRGRNLLWILAGAVAVGVLAVVAAYAPAGTKRLILFYAGYGLLSGIALVWLANEIRPQPGAWRGLVGAVLVALGSMNLAWISSRDYAEFMRTRNSKQIAALNMLSQIAGDDPEVAARHKEERRSLQPDFQDYLAFRVSQLGAWPAPWPTVFWLGEVLLAAVIAEEVIRRRQRSTGGE